MSIKALLGENSRRVNHLVPCAGLGLVRDAIE